MPGGSDPSTRVGRCAGYKCSCQAYRQAKGDKTWPVCECKHVQQSHANPEPVEIVPVPEGDAA